MNQIDAVGSKYGSKPVDRPRALWPACVMCAGALMVACSSGLGRVDGGVIDVTEHDQPLSDVMVVAVRETDVFALVESRFVCEDLRITRTNAHGRFEFEPWSQPNRSLWRHIFPGRHWVTLTAYKRGFASEYGGPGVPVNDEYRGVIRLKKMDDSFEHKIGYMLAVSREIPCVGGDFHLLKRPLSQQIESDAAALATTPEQLQYVRAHFGPSPGAQLQQPPPPPIDDSAPTSRAETH